MRRDRVCYAGAGAVVAVLGLTWRFHLLPLSPFVKKYGADALWALLVFLLIRLMQPHAKILVSAVIAFGISVTVELSQLYHADWIDPLRATRLGSLILGSIFNWPDIPAYAVGIALGAIIDAAILRRA